MLPFLFSYVLVLVAQLCPTLWDSRDCSPPGPSVYGDSPGKNTGVGYHALLQGFFLNQGLNRGVLHCRRVLYQLSHQGSPVLLTAFSLVSFKYKGEVRRKPYSLPPITCLLALGFWAASKEEDNSGLGALPPISFPGGITGTRKLLFTGSPDPLKLNTREFAGDWEENHIPSQVSNVWSEWEHC